MDPTLRALLTELFSLSLTVDQQRVQIEAQHARIAELEAQSQPHIPEVVI